MAAKQNSTAGKSCNSIPVTPETAQSYWMQLAEVESWTDLDAEIVKRFTEVFGTSHPAWLIRSNPFRNITGDSFRFYRKHILRLDVEQLAAYLRIHRSTIQRWESDAEPVPFATFEVLRLLSESTVFKLSHRIWDGWYIDCDGAFVSPKHGKLGFKPNELNQVTGAYAELSTARVERDRLAARVDELEAENASLRSGQKVKAIAGELAAMQDHLANLMNTLHTADVLPFPVSLDQHQTRKVAS